MSFVLEFEINGLPPTTNGSHGHWAVVARERKKWRDSVRMVAYYRRPPSPLEKAKLTLTRCSCRATDYDNRVISFKPVVDGLVDAKVLAGDTDSVIVERHYPFEKVGMREGKIRVRVEAVA